jgi:copper chaperone
MSSVILNVPDISCEHCERSITAALSPVEGISEVQVDIPAKQVCVTYDPALVNVDRVQAILEEEDYPVELGRLLVGSGLVAALSGLWMNAFLPAPRPRWRSAV